MPCLWIRSSTSVQVPSSDSEMLNVTQSFCLDFQMGFSGEISDLSSCQIPIPASPSSQKVLPAKTAGLTHSLCLMVPAWLMAAAVTGSLLSDVVGQRPGRRRHWLFCVPLAPRSSSSFRKSPIPCRQYFLPQLAQAAGPYIMTSLNRLSQVLLAGAGAFDDLINPK